MTAVMRPDVVTRSFAEAGAAWLDETEPGWRRLVDVDRLNMGNPCLCVAGQVFAGRDIGGCSGFGYLCDQMASTLGENTDLWLAEHGFVAYGFWDYQRLDREWRRAIVRSAPRRRLLRWMHRRAS